MVAAYLHGVETLNQLVGPRPVRQPRSAVIGLIGTAPIHHVPSAAAFPSTPVLVASDTDRAKLGPALSGYSIPSALRAIADKGAGTAIVINMFDPTLPAHQTSVAVSTYAIPATKTVQLPHGDLISVTVTTLADAACVAGVDYTVDRVTGTITIPSTGALSAAVSLKAAYIRANPSAVVASDIVGSVTVGGVRLGAQAFLNAGNLFGFNPKIFLAPEFTTTKSVETALLTIAARLRGIVLVDAPAGASRDGVIAARGPSGAFDLKSTSARVFYCFPRLKVGGKLEPYSQHFAGVIARTDAERGYWVSPSNKELTGVDATELPLSWGLNDPDCDTNLLNAAGIVTAAVGFGTGIRTWGNRSAAFPSAPDIVSFMSVQRTVDMCDEAIETATLRYVDESITQVMIDAIIEDMSAFFRLQESRKALVPGSKIEALPEDNPPSVLAAGQVVFTRTYCPPPPAERITYKSVVDVNLLKNVTGG